MHDRNKAGLINYFILIAKEKDVVAYIDGGSNRFAATHVADVAELYGMVLEYKGVQTKFHAVAEEGLTMKSIAENSWMKNEFASGIKNTKRSCRTFWTHDNFCEFRPCRFLQAEEESATVDETVGMTTWRYHPARIC